MGRRCDGPLCTQNFRICRFQKTVDLTPVSHFPGLSPGSCKGHPKISDQRSGDPVPMPRLLPSVRTFKDQIRSWAIIPLTGKAFRRQCVWFSIGTTSFRVEHSANRKPGTESRKNWPRGSPCAKPKTLIAGQPRNHFELHAEFFHASGVFPPWN